MVVSKEKFSFVSFKCADELAKKHNNLNQNPHSKSTKEYLMGGTGKLHNVGMMGKVWGDCKNSCETCQTPFKGQFKILKPCAEIRKLYAQKDLAIIHFSATKH